MWYVYILRCKNSDLYTGITQDISRRLEEHNNGKGGKFTKDLGVKELLYTEPYKTKFEALKRERQIKGWTRRKKLALINRDLLLLKSP